MSDKQEDTGISPSQKIEQLIGEAKKIQASASTAATRLAEGKEGQESKRTNVQREGPVEERGLKREILTTLTDTKEELSRIIGLLDEREIVTPISQTLPRYCSYCGRNLLPNALYCDRCGRSIRGA